MLEAQLPPTLPPTQDFEPEPRRRGILWVLIGVAGLVVLGGGGFLVWRYFLSGPTDVVNDPSVIPQEEVNLEVNTNSIPVNTNAPSINTNTPLPSPDQDQDGLTRDEESAFGTSDQDIDTDDDLLNDREEVMIYKTDPLNPDTDGDKFPDGEEVRNLYNPNGKGRLFSLEDIQS